jgi:hypothetical protein
MPPGARGPGKAQSTSLSVDEADTSATGGERPRDAAPNPPNRASTPATPSSSQGQAHSGTTTPETSAGQTAPPSPVGTTAIIPGEVRDYMRTRKVVVVVDCRMAKIL